MYNLKSFLRTYCLVSVLYTVEIQIIKNEFHQFTYLYMYEQCRKNVRK